MTTINNSSGIHFHLLIMMYMYAEREGGGEREGERERERVKRKEGIKVYSQACTIQITGNSSFMSDNCMYRTQFSVIYYYDL